MLIRTSVNESPKSATTPRGTPLTIPFISIALLVMNEVSERMLLCMDVVNWRSHPSPAHDNYSMAYCTRVLMELLVYQSLSYEGMRLICCSVCIHVCGHPLCASTVTASLHTHHYSTDGRMLPKGLIRWRVGVLVAFPVSEGIKGGHTQPGSIIDCFFVPSPPSYVICYPLYYSVQYFFAANCTIVFVS